LPDSVQRKLVRTQLGIPDGVPLVGQVVRFHPMKGHHRLLEAAATLARRHPGLRLLLVGRDLSPDRPELVAAIWKNGLEGNVILAGERSDIPRLMAGLDVAVSASEWCEGFPNVLGEAMASGLPCVATDVGDSAEVIEDCRRLVPAGDAAALANSIDELRAMSEEQRYELGLRARARIRRLYSLESLADRYVALYRMGRA